MANKNGEIRRSDNGVYIYLTPEEKDELDAICEYLSISRSQFVRIVTDAAYSRVLLGNYDISAEEIADRHSVGYGTVVDLCNLYE